MTEPERYAAAWDDYRRRWNLQFGSVSAFILIGLSGNLVRDWINRWKVTQLVFIALFGTCWLAYAVGLYRLPRWKCPRCAELYFHGLLPRFFRKRCANCGLPKFSTDPVS